MINIGFLAASWFKGGGSFWFLSFLSSAATIWVLGCKHGLQARIKKQNPAPLENNLNIITESSPTPSKFSLQHRNTKRKNK